MALQLESAPEEAYRAASIFARLGLDGEGIREAANLTPPLRVFSAQLERSNPFEPAHLVAVSWRFLVLVEERLHGWVTVRITERDARPNSMEFLQDDDPARAAFARLEAIPDDPASECSTRFVEIPWLGASFLWLTGKRPMFLDVLGPTDFAADAFVAEMERRRRERHSPTTPDPEESPRFGTGD